MPATVPPSTIKPPIRMAKMTAICKSRLAHFPVLRSRLSRFLIRVWSLVRHCFSRTLESQSPRGTKQKQYWGISECSSDHQCTTDQMMFCSSMFTRVLIEFPFELHAFSNNKRYQGILILSLMFRSAFWFRCLRIYSEITKKCQEPLKFSMF